MLRSLKQAYYSPRQPRPRRAAVDVLLPLHLADPPLPRPRLPPRAAVGARRRRARAARGELRRAGRVDVRARARGDDDRARRRRHRARASRSSGAVRGRLGADVRGRGHRADLGRVRSSRSAGPGPPAASEGIGLQGPAATRAMLPVRRRCAASSDGDWWALHEHEHGPARRAAERRHPATAIATGGSSTSRGRSCAASAAGRAAAGRRSAVRVDLARGA